MTKLDWRKARTSTGPGDFSGEISDGDSGEDRRILEEIGKRRRKALNKLPSNWLKTPEEVAAYKAAIGKKAK